MLYPLPADHVPYPNKRARVRARLLQHINHERLRLLRKSVQAKRGEFRIVPSGR